jgi:DNA-binding XRE family transcriptional regulator
LIFLQNSLDIIGAHLYNVSVKSKSERPKARKENKMTQERLYKLAYIAAVTIWGKEKDHLDANPNSELNQVREAKAWAELQEIESAMKALEA